MSGASDPAGPGASQTGSVRLTRLLVGLLCSLPFLLFFQATPNYRNPNELSRLLLTSAIVDDGSLQIDRALKRFGECQDISTYKGHYYSNKAIGYSLLAVPFYFVLRGLGHGQPDVLFYVLRIFVNLLPLLVFTLWLYRHLQREQRGTPQHAGVLCAAFLYGTLIFPYAQMFASHMLTGLCWFLAFHYLVRKDGNAPAFAAGAFLGFSFLLEIPSLILAPVFLAWTLVHKRRCLFPFSGGLFLLTLPAWIYNYEAFDHPLRWAYQLVATPELKAVVDQGYVGIGRPSFNILWKLTFGSNRGFFHFMPHLTFGLAGMALALRRSNREWLLPACSVVIFLFYSAYASWDGGWSFGPRFLVPLVPFFIYSTGQWFAFRDTSTRGSRAGEILYLVLVGMTIPVMVMGASTSLLLPRFLPLPVFWEVPILFWRGFFGLHWGELFGLSTAIVQVLIIVLVLVSVYVLLTRARVTPGRKAWLIGTALVMFLGFRAGTPLIEARMPATHCLAIGRIGYMQAQYGGARLFLQRAGERSNSPGLRQESEVWMQAVDRQLQDGQQP